MRRSFGLLAILGLLLAPLSAWSHHPTIAGEVVCDETEGVFEVNYTSTAWEGYPDEPASRENPHIDILMNGIVVDSGAYAAPDFSFSGTLAAPDGTEAGDIITLAAVARAEWGNGFRAGTSASTNVEVPDVDCAPPQVVNGRMTGGGRQIRVDGVRVTRGFTLHCDLLLSNNLQLNWPGGHRFHLNEHLETLVCSDDPQIIQEPPPAPFDTMIGVGTGRYDGEDGYIIHFTLVDAGEPGRFDEAAFRIYHPGTNEVVLEVPQQRIDGGNIQAHFDQPHK